MKSQVTKYIPGQDPSTEEDRLDALRSLEQQQGMDLPFLRRKEVMEYCAMEPGDWRYLDKYDLLGGIGGEKEHRAFTLRDVYVLRQLMVLRRHGAPHQVLRSHAQEILSEQIRFNI